MVKKTKEIHRFLSYISLMTVNLDKTGLKSIINDIDLLFIDIWGVLHNGIKLYKESINVLDKLEQSKKEYILLTNAPRPNNTVINFLKNLGLDQSKCKKVSTSGEVALKYLKSKYKALKFFHVGPPRDFDLFKSFEEFIISIFDVDPKFEKSIIPFIDFNITYSNPCTAVDLLIIENLFPSSILSKNSYFDRIHIFKFNVSFITKFTFWKSHFWQNSHF